MRLEGSRAIGGSLKLVLTKISEVNGDFFSFATIDCRLQR